MGENIIFLKDIKALFRKEDGMDVWKSRKQQSQIPLIKYYARVTFLREPGNLMCIFYHSFEYAHAKIYKE